MDYRYYFVVFTNKAQGEIILNSFYRLMLSGLFIFGIPTAAQEGVSDSVLIPSSITDMGDLGPKYFNLSTSNSAREVVLTIRTENGVATINPKPYVYTGLSLPEMTAADAIKKFGPARQYQDFNTFDLWSNRAEINVFHLDVRFEKSSGKIHEYRVRGIGISKPVWTKV